MIGKRVLEEKYITSSEAKEILSSTLKNRKEPSYEQKTASEYLAKFSKFKAAKSRALVDELLKSNPRIKLQMAVKLVDLMPKDEDDVRAVFAKERFTLTKEDVKSILEILSR